MKTMFRSVLTSATRLTRQGRLVDATRLILDALDSSLKPVPPPDARVVPPAKSVSPVDAGRAATPYPLSDGATPAGVPGDRFAQPPGRASFDDAIHSHGGLTRHYKLFVPAGLRAAPALVVMLHGCTQDADDFARGTRINERAQRDGFVVLYPVQSRAANQAACWNWFRPDDQRRGHGEAAFIADLAATTIARQGIDAKRVFIAGLSAGGAMAAIVASEYPEIFAAVAVHSGLAPGAARNLPDALNAMRSGRIRNASFAVDGTTLPRVPTIVFHGDRDTTVHPANADQLVAATVGAAATRDPASTVESVSTGGQRVTTACYPAADGAPPVEQWTLHGAGHAWSGGDPRGSYTDPAGIDATGEMLRFFDEQSR